MNRPLARFISVVFHPLLVPTYLFAFILYYLPVPTLSLAMQSRWIVLLMIFFTTFVIPSLGAYVMVRAGHLSSMEMENREQRGLPLMFTCLCYATTAFLFYKEPAFDEIFYFVMAIIAASVFITYLISFYWKISAHGVGVGGGLGLVVMLHKIAPDTPMLYAVVGGMMIAGAVLSARLALHAHTPEQVYAGFGSGFLLAVTACAIAF